ncbi:MAG: hypothetical protein EOO65_04355 [Methanosarcinales archaeon]|nr:MAG: hypothetical protein EOO65_04355 [Methanosarcinales archaeon]
MATLEQWRAMFERADTDRSGRLSAAGMLYPCAASKRTVSPAQRAAMAPRCAVSQRGPRVTNTCAYERRCAEVKNCVRTVGFNLSDAIINSIYHVYDEYVPDETSHATTSNHDYNVYKTGKAACNVSSRLRAGVCVVLTQRCAGTEAARSVTTSSFNSSQSCPP